MVFGAFAIAHQGTSTPANEIADSVVRRLEPRLAASVAPKPRDRSPNIAADELYRMSNNPAFGRSDSGAQTSLGYLKRAIELDSTYAAAHAAITLRYLRVRSGEGAEASKRTRIALARRAAETAVRLDDSLVAGHLARAQIAMEDYDWQHAERELQRAIDLDPRDVDPRIVLASLYSVIGPVSKALAQARYARDLDSLSPEAHAEYARALASNHQCDEALKHLDRIGALQQPLLRNAGIAASCYAEQRRWSDAIRVYEKTAASSVRHRAVLGYLRGRTGDRGGALLTLENVHRTWQQNHQEGAYDVAIVYAGLGDFDRAFEWLDRAIADRSFPAKPNEMLIFGPLFDRLQQDPRFPDLRRKINLPALPP
jgi:tetratricopeptide (TPR) repeat protein